MGKKENSEEPKKSFKEVFFHNFVIGTFVALYLIVSLISTIHVIAFFELSNPYWLAVSLAIAFEIGAAASLSSIIILGKVDKRLVWFLFILLTGMQAMGNTYYAFTNLENYKDWIDLFGLNDMEVIAQKRILSIVSGAILPIVALGFIKSLVDYMKPDTEVIDNSPVKAEEKPKKVVFEKVEKVEDPIVKDIIETHAVKGEYKIPMTEDSKDDKKVEFKTEPVKKEEETVEEIIDEIVEEMKNESIDVPIKKETKKVKTTKKIEAKTKETTNFEKELDALKNELEKEKKKTKFEIELDATRKQIQEEKDKNKALKIKREKDQEEKKKIVKKEEILEEKKKVKIEKEIEKDNNKTVKEVKVKPMVKRNPNPTRAL